LGGSDGGGSTGEASVGVASSGSSPGACPASALPWHRVVAHEFTSHRCEQTLHDHFGVATLSGFGIEEVDASVCAAGAIIQYLMETQLTALDHIAALTRRSDGEAMGIDGSSWQALEIDRTLRAGRREGSLLHAVDRTVHPIGARMLRRWLCAPLIDAQKVVERQDAVAYLMEADAAQGPSRGSMPPRSAQAPREEARH